MADNLRFLECCEKVRNNLNKKDGIGTLGEKTLHAVLKNYFEPYEDNQEISLGGYVADIAGENGVIEIQTRNFAPLRRKLEAFLEYTNVTVVYPVAKIKYVAWLDNETGELMPKRRSPKKGTIYDAVKELYKIKYTLDNPNFNLCIVMLEVDEIRNLNGWSKDKKKGSSRYDRIPLNLLDEIYFHSPEDFRKFIPDGLPDIFTSADFAKCAKIKRNIAQITINLLCYLELVEKTGTQGRNNLYKIIERTQHNEL
ncbi:MAG: hypothetical protein ACI4RN_01350 [Oscillospiraceae bacterium]